MTTSARSRLTVFFRLLLAIPLFIWFGLWSIGVFFAAIIGWFAALFTGRLPQGLHDFFGMYVRYATHLGAYLAIAANPYPSFTGTPGYAVDVSIPERQSQPRWKTAFRLLLAIPALMLAATLGSFAGGGGGSQAAEDGGSKAEWFASSGFGGVAAVCAILGWFAAVALSSAIRRSSSRSEERSPRSHSWGGSRHSSSAGCRSGSATSPRSGSATRPRPTPTCCCSPTGIRTRIPRRSARSGSCRRITVRLALDDDGRRSRLTVFFRLLLAIPHFVWLALWTIAAFLAAIANFFVALVRGRSADALHRFLAAYVRYYRPRGGVRHPRREPVPGLRGQLRATRSTSRSTRPSVRTAG